MTVTADRLQQAVQAGGDDHQPPCGAVLLIGWETVPNVRTANGERTLSEIRRVQWMVAADKGT